MARIVRYGMSIGLDVVPVISPLGHTERIRGDAQDGGLLLHPVGDGNGLPFDLLPARPRGGGPLVGARRFVPSKIVSTAGRVQDAENLLIDDFRGMRFGLPDCTAAFLDQDLSRRVSSVQCALGEASR